LSEGQNRLGLSEGQNRLGLSERHNRLGTLFVPREGNTSRFQRPLNSCSIFNYKNNLVLDAGSGIVESQAFKREHRTYRSHICSITKYKERSFTFTS
jgi:hypothetical protein